MDCANETHIILYFEASFFMIMRVWKVSEFIFPDLDVLSFSSSSQFFQTHLRLRHSQNEVLLLAQIKGATTVKMVSLKKRRAIDISITLMGTGHSYRTLYWTFCASLCSDRWYIAFIAVKGIRMGCCYIYRAFHHRTDLAVRDDLTEEFVKSRQPATNPLSLFIAGTKR